ncbi:glutamate/tyrosine decarboxylase-like PLP-dependent enzyme [Halorubrum alkaliphilum]|uniref:Glutamate/tyrosine decarboxylase-like PLP-dependent enzyme n=1 Tax=Halorubrum alkaliphilum TaxID=261290 RepID=A0A8T4GF21_9EURY|nr:hypothetical protein [Halorubrum alkaliphilum]MBP1923098.1 glutamate/tyrosine decarboxylase-like PLP-dependent enzyme [Halorubrum alkaliphilum]
MTDIEAAIREAFEHTEYDLGDVGINRQQVRIPVLQEGADPEALRAIVDEAVGEDGVVGLTVTTETIGGDDAVGTVVTFQYRP